MTAVLQRCLDNRFVHWLLQAKRLPLLYAVTVLTAIFYHYNAAWTPIWLVLTFFFELGVFKLCELVDKHHLIGGALFCMAGIVTLGIAFWFIYIGERPELFDNLFLPEGVTRNINFYVWFLTPQSVVNAFYGPYTFALLFLFSFFIGFATYYFTFVQYRVLMSFSILCFPFAIYAKEAENMPILCIIILFACYFSVMLFCRQLHADDPDVIYYYDQDMKQYPMPTVVAKTHTKEKPELSDGAGWRAGAMFLSAACIVVLAIPKPTVHEDRNYIESLINFSAFTDALLNAINGFEEESNGGTDVTTRSSQVLFYAETDEPVNLRRVSMACYSYESDSWKACTMDEKTNESVAEYDEFDSALLHENFDLENSHNYYGKNFISPSYSVNAYDTYRLLRSAAEKSPAFAEKWGLSGLVGTDLDVTRFLNRIDMSAAGFNGQIYLAPNQTYFVRSATYGKLLQNTSSIIYRDTTPTIFHERFTVEYLSERIVSEPEIQLILRTVSDENFEQMLTEIQNGQLLGEEESRMLENLRNEVSAAAVYRLSNMTADETRETPERIITLAKQLTEGCATDYDKARAVMDYLLSGEYTYNLNYIRGEGANVDTFLFESKEGVCYQFATAMAELCRNAGLTVRYVEGYSLSELNNSILSDENEYVIRTNHAHAFVEVYLAGYGWMSFDATAPDYHAEEKNDNEGVLNTLQYTGIIMLIGGILVLLTLYFVVPVLQEAIFRRKYQKARDGKAVEAAFARLRKQWDADPALTARVLCGQMAEKLQCDTAVLMQGMEAAVYGRGCTREMADAVFVNYCELRAAWKETQKRLKKEARLQKKQMRAKKDVFAEA